MKKLLIIITCLASLILAGCSQRFHIVHKIDVQQGNVVSQDRVDRLEVAWLGGTGGCIALDPAGRGSLRCNTPAMARGVARAGGRAELAIGRDEPLRPAD